MRLVLKDTILRLCVLAYMKPRRSEELLSSDFGLSGIGTRDEAEINISVMKCIGVL